MAKLTLVCYFILVGCIFNLATSNDVTSDQISTLKTAEPIGDQVTQDDLVGNQNDQDGDIYFLDGGLNDDIWFDQLLEDTFNAILTDVQAMLNTDGSDSEFLNGSNQLQVNVSVNTSGLQDAEISDLQLMEMIVDTTIEKLVDAIQEESQEAEADEELLEELKEELEAAKSLEEIIRSSLANQTEEEDNNSEATFNNEESVGKFYVNRMRFWKQVNFEENTESTETEAVPEVIEYEEL